MRDMVMNAYAPVTSLILQEATHQEEQESIVEAKRFLERLKAVEKPLYEGCQMSLLKAIARLTNEKCEFNLPHRAVEGIAAFMKEICPNNNEIGLLELNARFDSFSALLGHPTTRVGTS